MEDDRSLSKLLTRNASANSSSRIFYYGRNAGAVPFLWESRPGTPKHHRHCPDNPLPPLTPPPSYFMSPGSSKLLLTPDRNPNNLRKQQSKMLGTVFPKLRRLHNVSPASSSVSSASSSSSSSSSWSLGSRGRKPSCVKLGTLEFKYHDRDRLAGGHDEECVSSPRSVMGFGNPRPKNKAASGTARLFRGCYPVPSMKNKLLSIVGHGPSQGQ